MSALTPKQADLEAAALRIILKAGGRMSTEALMWRLIEHIVLRATETEARSAEAGLVLQGKAKYVYDGEGHLSVVVPALTS